jgi:hypothetical protein
MDLETYQVKLTGLSCESEEGGVKDPIPLKPSKD